MKLAEALAQRADASRRIEQLRSRATRSARYQEGEEPAEDAVALLAEAESTLDQLEILIRSINSTNAQADLGDLGTVTDALARRDVLRARHRVLTDVADSAAGRDQDGYFRQMRSELRMVSAVSVADLRHRADQVARELRDLDVRIQQANWQVDLMT